MPKGTDEEKAARSVRIQEAMRGAIETPLEMMRACHAAVEQASAISRLGNQNAASDVKIALGLLQAGLRGARENVEINFGSVKDQEYIARVRQEMERLTEHVTE